MSDERMNRRAFLRAGVGVGAVAAGAGSAAAQEGGESGGTAFDYGGYLDGANNWGGAGSTVDATGQDEVAVEVGAGSGGLAFEPPGVHVDPGTTVVFEWTGEGGAHNVQTDGNQPVDFQSEIVGDEGFTFEQEIPGDFNGIIEYFCSPHQGQGMLGALAVGDAPTRSLSQATPPPLVDESARTLGVATMIAMVSTLGLAYFFMKYGGDYEQ